jgi:hypothetical protein
MNTQSLKVTSHEMPLPLSAVMSARSSGDGSSPGTSGYRIRAHRAAGPGAARLPRAVRHSMADM